MKKKVKISFENEQKKVLKKIRKKRKKLDVVRTGVRNKLKSQSLELHIKYTHKRIMRRKHRKKYE